MQIVYHIGANCTDAERLLRSLLRNADQLRQSGVRIPGPSRYRKILRETILSSPAAVPSAASREVLLDAIIDGQDAQRLVMSNSTFICQHARLFEGGQFYGMAASKVATFRQLFPTDTVELFLGLRNPATFIPAVWNQVPGRAFHDFLDGMDPRLVRWSDLVARITAAAPDARLTVWLNEDTPLIWSEILRRMAGLPPDTPMEGQYDLLATIMSPEGMARFQSYMDTHPGQTETQARRVIGAFLDKYAIPEAIEEEIDAPGWDARIVEDLTRAYEADVARIANMPGVTYIAP